jgi:hypothetical protein
VLGDFGLKMHCAHGCVFVCVCVCVCVCVGRKESKKRREDGRCWFDFIPPSLLLRLGSGGRGHVGLYRLCLHLLVV